MWNLRNKTDEDRGKAGKIKIKTEREANHKRLLNIENKGFLEGGWLGG